MVYFCAQSNRRELVLLSPTLNGIDYLEVVGPAGCGTQLALTFLKDARELSLAPGDIQLTGDTTITVTSITAATDADPYTVTIQLDQTGDFAPYVLTLSNVPHVDSQLDTVQFSFKAGCPTPADCLSDSCCSNPLPAPPDINYLAKDYAGFLQMMLDRLAVLVPGWTERHAADLGIAMVETLAYAADHLSYQQDAVTTEAYITTARSRISLRRHAKLVDYTPSEGCNARTLVFVDSVADNIVVPKCSTFYVGSPGLPVVAEQGGTVDQQLAAAAQPAFMSLQDATVFTAHNQIDFYTWGDGDCCLPAGSTQATLCGPLPDLQVGDILIFEELVGPDTGQQGDADPTHRCAVVLTSVQPSTDPLIADTAVVEIGWSDADALTFPLCISSTSASQQPVSPVSVARGNVVPVDQGYWIASLTVPPGPDNGEALGVVPAAAPTPVASGGCSCGSEPAPIPRYYPNLAQSPLTFAAPFSGPPSSATGFLAGDAAAATPEIRVRDETGQAWVALSDLLSSNSGDRYFVPEIEFDGSVFLRFGDGQYGANPDAGMSFYANYRIGNGSAGNVGRDTIAHVVPPASWLGSLSDFALVRNPLPATGGIDPEDMNHIRQFAPFSYQTQERCVTEADYGQEASQLTAGAEAVGTMRWTGSWYTAFVSLDPTALTPLTVSETTSGLNLLRMIGTDVAVEPGVIVGLEIVLEVCVAPQYFRGDVYNALMEIFVSGNQCDGTPGLLSPSNFSFGQMVLASPLIAAAQAVDGVLSVTLDTFTRMDMPWIDGATQGYLQMGRLDIPRCDNDPNHLERGTFTLRLDGGR